MDRREFLRTTGAAAAATAAVATGTAPAEATPSAAAASKGLQELRIAVPFEDGFAGPADWTHRLARRVGEASGGRWSIVPAFAIADPVSAVRAGFADLCFASSNALLGVHRGAAYFAGLPGDQGLAPTELQTWITVGGGQALWDDLAASVGLKPLLAAHTGSRSLMLATHRIETMGALAGLKARVDGLGRDVARGLGLDAVAPADSHLAPAMQRGEVEVAECGGAIVSYALGLPAIAGYTTGTSINRNGTAMFLGVRQALWDSLGASEQTLLSGAAASEYQLSLAEEEAHRHLLLPVPSAERTWPIAADLGHAIQRVAAAVVAHAAGTDATSRRISDSYVAFRRMTAGEDVSA